MDWRSESCDREEWVGSVSEKGKLKHKDGGIQLFQTNEYTSRWKIARPDTGSRVDASDCVYSSTAVFDTTGRTFGILI
jgi:hypothetical protein